MAHTVGRIEQLTDTDNGDIEPDLMACPFCGKDPTLTKFAMSRRLYYAVRCGCDSMMHTCDDMTHMRLR